MNSTSPGMERLTELLTDEALGELDGAANEELEELMKAGTGLDRDDFMTLAGLMQVGFLRRDATAQERLPDHLREKITQQAQDFFKKGPAQNDPAPVTDIGQARTTRSRDKAAAARRPWLNPNLAGWYLAAALALAFVVLRPETPAELSPVDQRAAVLEAEDTLVVPWSGEAAAAGYSRVSGDVVWNNRQQKGYMRLAGLAANDSSRAQYQLWIVDPERDTRPVDGGVFDVPPGADEIIIPIDSKLPIKAPAAFAITLEQPGGVVVSDGPLLVVAPVSG